MASMYLTVCVVFSLISLVAAQCGSVCYGELGCFTDCPPFEEFVLPRDSETVDTQFWLYTRNTPGIFEFELISADNLGNLFNPNWETIFFVHGWAQSGLDSFIHEHRETFHQRNDYNFIVVDWSGSALSEALPTFAWAETQVVGAEMALLAERLQAERGLQLSDVYAIGYSMGAQVCGFFGNRINGQIGRITGFDPAGQLFDVDSPDVRLDPSDAAFVDAIHTNADAFLVQYGTTVNNGHVDFWPASGGQQPGCARRADGCSHARSHQYYLASLQGLCVYQGQPCATYDDMLDANCPLCNGSNCQELGFEAVNNPGRGMFYNEILSEFPHC